MTIDFPEMIFTRDRQNTNQFGRDIFHSSLDDSTKLLFVIL